jgi:hypothetical protein
VARRDWLQGGDAERLAGGGRADVTQPQVAGVGRRDAAVAAAGRRLPLSVVCATRPAIGAAGRAAGAAPLCGVGAVVVEVLLRTRPARVSLCIYPPPVLVPRDSAERANFKLSCAGTSDSDSGHVCHGRPVCTPGQSDGGGESKLGQ